LWETRDNLTLFAVAPHADAAPQGGFSLAKARGGPDPALDSVAHLKRYFTLLFGRAAAT